MNIEATHYDDHTMGKVYRVLTENGHSQASASDVVSALQNEGILFRERVPEEYWASLETTEETVTEEPKEWIERQEEERRAWAINTAVEHLKEFSSFNEDTVINLAGKIEAFVKGPQEDPDLHDQTALDLFYVFWEEHSLLDHLEHRESLGVDRPSDESVHEAATEFIDRITRGGIRLKIGKVLDNVEREQ